MKLWGLTGGIASGKSSVHRMLLTLGAHVVDADAVYHRLVAPEGGAPSRLTQAIAAQFGAVITADGALDRRALGAIAFADPQARARLEAVTHPAVGAAVQQQLTQWADAGVEHAVYDVPLLFELEMQARFAGVVLVWVPRAVQHARLKLRDGIDDDAAELRLRAQLPLDSKREHATWCIDNSGSLDQTQTQVITIWRDICQRHLPAAP